MADALNLFMLIAVFAGYPLVDAEVCYATYSVNNNDKYKIDCEHGCCGYYYYRKCCSDPLIPVIVGSVVGGVVFLGSIIFLIYLCVYCSKKQNRSVNPIELNAHYAAHHTVYQHQTIAVAYHTPNMTYSLPNQPPPDYDTVGSSNPPRFNQSLPEKS